MVRSGDFAFLIPLVGLVGCSTSTDSSVSRLPDKVVNELPEAIASAASPRESVIIASEKGGPGQKVRINISGSPAYRPKLLEHVTGVIEKLATNADMRIKDKNEIRSGNELVAVMLILQSDVGRVFVLAKISAAVPDRFGTDAPGVLEVSVWE